MDISMRKIVRYLNKLLVTLYLHRYNLTKYIIILEIFSVQIYIGSQFNYK